MGRVRAALWLDLAVKAALVGLLLFAVARPDAWWSVSVE
jgi:hypothetical protein